MVRVRRHLKAPDKLTARRGEWLARWVCINNGQRKGGWATPAAHEALRAALLPITHGKCAYCESWLNKDAYLEVDHYAAKTVRPELCFDWSNLLPACQICNRSKGERDHGNLLLKPDAEDPEDYFWLDPDSGELQPRPGLTPGQAARATETISLCRLQRGQLCESRLVILGRVRRWLHQMSASEDVTDALLEEWESLAKPETEHKLALRHELRRLRAEELAEEDRRRFEAPPTTDQ